MQCLRSTGLAFIAFSAIAAPSAFGAPTETPIYSSRDIGYPLADLLVGPAGQVFGTSHSKIFELTPPPAGLTQWTSTILANFGGDGFSAYNGNGYPFSAAGGLISDAAGDLFGVSLAGGDSNAGTIYALKPPQNGHAGWGKHVLYSFTGGADGATPMGRLVEDETGALYGTNSAGGAGFGTAFKLSPPAAPGAAWTLQTIHTFRPGQGTKPLGSLIRNHRGQLFGISTGSPGGVVFRLEPPTDGRAAWHYTTLHKFAGGVDGDQPMGALIFGADHNTIYGTTYTGGAPSGHGTVYQLVHKPGTFGWSKTTLHYFQQGAVGGAGPVAGLTRRANGELFGTTYYGGMYLDSTNRGAAFKLTPPSRPGDAWKEIVIHDFAGLVCHHLGRATSDGCYPDTTLISNGAGGYFGTTYAGGSEGTGVVFYLTP